MRETKFIEQNKEKWEQFEETFERKDRDPDKLSRLFVQLTDDLSYARTFYPNRSVRIYLNNIAQKVFHSIYKSRKVRFKQFKTFWQDELPQIVYTSRKELLLSLIIFLLAMSIGVLSSIHDPAFARFILGDAYVNMTIENIEKGDPMAVYKQMNAVDMFLGITVNNLFVAFRTFLLGIVLGIGAVGSLLYNGIMVGTFQFFFFERGLFWESFLTIWLHGTLEIASIIIAGGAGLVLGRGLVFPGTYSRIRSFQMSAVKGLKLLLGIAPIFVMAALIEGFLTRYTGVPPLIKATVILLSAGFIITYFVWYPYMKAKQGFRSNIKVTSLSSRASRTLSFSSIRSVGGLFTDSFTFYKRSFTPIFISALFLSLIYAGAVTYFLGELPTLDWKYGIWYSFLGAIRRVAVYFHFQAEYMLYMFNTAILAVHTMFVFFLVHRASEKKEYDNKFLFFSNAFLDYVLRYAVPGLLTIGLINSFFLVQPPVLALALFFIGIPVSLLGFFILAKERVSFWKVPGRLFFLLRKRWFKLFGLATLLFFVGFLLFYLINAPLLWIYVRFLSWNITLEGETLQKFWLFVQSFLFILVLKLVLPLLYSGFGLLYFSLRETQEARDLKKRADHFLINETK